MGCIVILAIFMPRVALFLLWLFTNYIGRAYDGLLLPLLGFFFLPTTTIGYAIAENEYNGLEGTGLIFVIVGLVLDLGLLSQSSKGKSPFSRRRAGW